MKFTESMLITEQKKEVKIVDLKILLFFAFVNLSMPIQTI